SISFLKSLIVLLINLKEFQLECYYSTNDLLDGNQWESFTSHLKKFDFRFNLNKNQYENISQIINSFSSSFWTNNKHWWISYNKNSICTIPKYSPSKYKINCENDLFPQSLTSPLSIYFSQVNDLSIENFEYLTKPIYHRFSNVKILRLMDEVCKIKPDFLSLFINLNQIEEIQIITLDIHTQFLLEHIPYVRSLRFDYLSNNLSTCLKHIRSIEYYSSSNPISGQIIEQFCQIFPQVQYLHIVVKTVIDMYQCINRLRNLSKAFFRIENLKQSLTLTNIYESTRLTSYNSTIEFCGITVDFKINHISK
ncbi:unnamed protein product, partial [Adineta steineri]